MPPANPRPLRWTEGQIERLLWAPQDHSEHLQKMQRRSKGRRSGRSDWERGAISGYVEITSYQEHLDWGSSIVRLAQIRSFLLHPLA